MAGKTYEKAGKAIEQRVRRALKTHSKLERKSNEVTANYGSHRDNGSEGIVRTQSSYAGSNVETK